MTGYSYFSVAERVEGNEICSLDSFAKIFENIHDKTAAVFKPEHDYVRCALFIYYSISLPTVQKK